MRFANFTPVWPIENVKRIVVVGVGGIPLVGSMREDPVELKASPGWPFFRGKWEVAGGRVSQWDPGMKNRDQRDLKDPRDKTSGLRTERFIPPHGGYEALHSYQKALIVFQATVYFCDRFLDRRDRTYDQMVQAARSGKQNIVEGSQISGTSKELELKLTNVARASQEELLEDYRDFLRSRGLKAWAKDHPYVRRLRQLNRISGASCETFRRGIEHPDPAICANVILGLVILTCFLLDRQILALEKAFLEHGGLREAMLRARVQARRRRA